MEGTVQKSENKLTGTLSSNGSLSGGMIGVYGKDGKSAYEVAVKNGFEGSESEWLESLKGEKGDKGATGMTGMPGMPGKSPVVSATKSGKVTSLKVDGTEIAQINDGNDGTMTFEDLTAEQKASLKGDKGDKGEKGEDGARGADGAKGADGVSATHSWNGTVLTITSASGTSSANLKGNKGDTGEKGDKGDTGNSGVYLGSGDMPADCNVQIDPNGSVTTIDTIVQAVINALPVYGGELV